MNPDQILTPTTPTSWIISNLRQDELLGRLLGSGPTFPNPGANWGQGGVLAPIHKAGEVPAQHADRFVVVKPPVGHDTDYYANLSARKMDSVYLVWGETRSDKLPPGCDFDAVLEPIFKRIIRSLYHVTSTEAIGGHVLQVEILDAYTPLPVDIGGKVKVAQWGVQLALISTV